VFNGLYNVEGGIDKAIKVDAYIPGCPASPQAIIDGFAKLLKALEESHKSGGKPVVPPEFAVPGAPAEGSGT